MIKNRSKIYTNILLLLLIIISGFLFNIFLKRVEAAQTSNSLYFLSINEDYFKGKSNELIPEEGSAIWHIITNFDNETIYIHFALCDPTNPGESYQDKLVFYIYFGNESFLENKKAFKYSIRRDGIIDFFQYHSDFGKFVRVSPSDDSYGVIEIIENWQVFYTFNYSKLGYPEQPENQTIKIMAYYVDYVIGSSVLTFHYPSGCSENALHSWATGYFLDGYEEDNTFYIYLTWIIASIIIVVVAFMGFGSRYYRGRGSKKYNSSKGYKKIYNSRLVPESKENDIEEELESQLSDIDPWD
ncbi:MAG: hypothetical protein GF329_16225 [Candidatus Lokiarchaeota archaeon]|nr:hypothetical protein [Candidatus Lokiarchaeota archaeon]